MRYRIVIAQVVLAALVLGCQSNKPSNEDVPVVQSIATVRQQVLDTAEQVQRTDVLLGELQTASDPKPTLARLQTAMTSLLASAEHARQRGQGMRQSRDAYIADWIKEIQAIGDLNAQDKAVRSRQLVEAHFDKITELANAARTAFGPYVTGLDQISRVLSADPTSTRVQTLSGSITKTKADGRSLLQAIQALSAELDTLKGSIEPLKPAN